MPRSSLHRMGRLRWVRVPSKENHASLAVVRSKRHVTSFCCKETPRDSKRQLLVLGIKTVSCCLEASRETPRDASRQQETVLSANCLLLSRGSFWSKETPCFMEAFTIVELQNCRISTTEEQCFSSWCRWW